MDVSAPKGAGQEREKGDHRGSPLLPNYSIGFEYHRLSGSGARGPGQIEAVQVHHLVPCGGEIAHERFL